jgi:hypothetical protein
MYPGLLDHSAWLFLVLVMWVGGSLANSVGIGDGSLLWSPETFPATACNISSVLLT